MISRWRAIGFLLAALGLVLALLLPLSSEATPALTARGALLAAIIAEVVLFALAAPFPRLETVAGLIAAVLGCAATLILLKDHAIAGSAAWGYWLLVLATWLGAALTVTSITALPPAGRVLRWVQDLSVPLLFGAFVVYLWEVAVRGFGVPSVLMPAPSATAWRLVANPGRGFRADVLAQRARGLRDRLRTGLFGRHRRLSLRFSQTRPAPARQLHLGAAGRRHRSDHGDVVRLRLAIESGRRRRDVLLSDVG
jgi:hypothetical protein